MSLVVLVFEILEEGIRFFRRVYPFIKNRFPIIMMSLQENVPCFVLILKTKLCEASVWAACWEEVTNLLWSLFEHFRKVWLQAEAWSKICRSTYTILLHIESLQNKKCSIQSNIAIPKLTFGYHMSHVFEFFIAVTFRHFFFWTWNSCPITRVNFFPNRYLLLYTLVEAQPPAAFIYYNLRIPCS